LEPVKVFFRKFSIIIDGIDIGPQFIQVFSWVVIGIIIIVIIIKTCRGLNFISKILNISMAILISVSIINIVGLTQLTPSKMNNLDILYMILSPDE
jgi:hypothetical protein